MRIIFRSCLLLVCLFYCICLSCIGYNHKRDVFISDVKTDSIFRCSEHLGQQILKDDELRVIFYIEGDYCASCHATLIYPLLTFLEDSIGGYGKPIMFWHPDNPNQEMINMCQAYFGNECELFFTTEDSIRAMNDWMNPKISSYIIIIGPSKKILYSSHLYDKHFLSMARALREINLE